MSTRWGLDDPRREHPTARRVAVGLLSLFVAGCAAAFAASPSDTTPSTPTTSTPVTP